MNIPLWVQALTAIVGALALADRVTRWAVKAIRSHIVSVWWDHIETPKAGKRLIGVLKHAERMYHREEE